MNCGQRRLEVIPELIADPTWRHEAGAVKKLDMAATTARVQASMDRFPTLLFEAAMLSDDGTTVTVVWNGTVTDTSGKTDRLNGIEVFRIVEGKIVEVWNSPPTPGHWAPTVNA